MAQGEEVQPNTQRAKIFEAKSKVKWDSKDEFKVKVYDDAFPGQETYYTTTYPNISSLSP